VLLCLPSDHVIRPADVFRATALRALARADSARTLVTFGVMPRWPSTGYGYLEQGKKVAPGIRRVKRFLEKPKKKVAKQLVKGGKHRWNSGMFAWRADVYLEEVGAHLPDLAKGLDRLREDPGRVAEVFPDLPAISVDYGVMEKTDHAEMVKADFEWDDVGSFEAFARLIEPDEQQNHARGEFLGVGAKGVVSVAPAGHLVAALGVKDLVVVVTEDATLVCRRKHAEKVKELVEKLPPGRQ
jgi:mannose-1-phosphate guanylyltransferase